MIKRSFDFCVAVAALVVVSPLIALAALAIRMESAGPVFHRAVRMGRYRVPFTLFKLRSMHVGSASAGPGVTAAGDERITRVGGLCRRFKIDELPQLVNVIRGDMSLVGPRPEDARYLPNYEEAQLALFSFRPGITSPASVTFRDEEGALRAAMSDGRDLDSAYRDIQATKLNMELAYFPRATLRSDVVWLFRTIAAVAR
ncbi:MAG: sugar transferase [Acidimicrobiales bacterium]|nr:sugar transferase [Acidimicrobiales bacterium]